MEEGSSSNSERYDLVSLLSSENRDFLITNNGKQVDVRELFGKVVGLYFCGSCSSHFLNFNAKLNMVYQQLYPKANFEVVYISYDEDLDAFFHSLSKMPWLAIPFCDSKSITRVSEKFNVNEVPRLVILDGAGEILTLQGVEMLMEDSPMVGSTPLELWRPVELGAYRKESLMFFLASSTRDFLISRDGRRTPVAELEGKLVGLFFFAPLPHPRHHIFTEKLVETYIQLKNLEANFEVVLVYSKEDNEELFDEWLQQMPWFALPFKDRNGKKLARYFSVRHFPRLVIIGTDGKTLNHDATDLIEKQGVQAFPFEEEQSYTLKSLLVKGESDYVIDKTGSQVYVGELVGRPLIIYFSSAKCSLCQVFTQLMTEAYHKIKAKVDKFEIIFVSMDRNQSSFDESYSNMPWLALPFGDDRTSSLHQKLRVMDTPSVVAIGPHGRIITAQARYLIAAYGAEAYPFTEDHIDRLAKWVEQKAKGWPETLNHPAHDEHELMKVVRGDCCYLCDLCKYPGHGWSFYCKDCDFDLHPKCALNVVDGEMAKREVS